MAVSATPLCLQSVVTWNGPLAAPAFAHQSMHEQRPPCWPNIARQLAQVVQNDT